MKASELIKELEKTICGVGDKEVYFWNTNISDFMKIYSVYSTCGSIECIALDGEEDD